MGSWLDGLVTHDAWALWLAAPAASIALVCLAVWWWSRPARPATTPRSIAGHHDYLEALVRAPRERVSAPVAGRPEPVADPLAPVVVLDATDDPLPDDAGRPDEPVVTVVHG